MARTTSNVATKPIEDERQLVIIHSQRFNLAQWNHLKQQRDETGCSIQEYIRRLVDEDRKKVTT